MFWRHFVSLGMAMWSWSRFGSHYAGKSSSATSRLRWQALCTPSNQVRRGGVCSLEVLPPTMLCENIQHGADVFTQVPDLQIVTYLSIDVIKLFGIWDT
ncbi:hypothetical protein IG631_11934 [Alternaria alternata]|nr:hypothetical protein IG631_11934 [Alternaria alternata]